MLKVEHRFMIKDLYRASPLKRGSASDVVL